MTRIAGGFENTREAEGGDLVDKEERISRALAIAGTVLSSSEPVTMRAREAWNSSNLRPAL